MVAGQDDDLPVFEQILGVEPDEVVGRAVQQRDVGPALAKHPAAGAPAEHDVHWGGAVGVQDPGQQARVTAGLHDEREPALGFGGAEGVQGDPALGEQLRAGRGERDLAAGAVEQLGADAPLQLPDRAGERRLGHPEAFGGATEMQLLGHREEA